MRFIRLNGFRPSVTHQWIHPRRAYILLNWLSTRVNSSQNAVVFPMKVEAIFQPCGGSSQMLLFTLFGIH
jgi:hypothetical protein